MTTRWRSLCSAATFRRGGSVTIRDRLRRIDWRSVLLMAGLVAASCLAGACAAWLVLNFWGCPL